MTHGSDDRSRVPLHDERERVERGDDGRVERVEQLRVEVGAERERLEEHAHDV